MPKMMKIRETTNPIGLKFHEVMAEKHMDGDYRALAAVFGVKTPSVYDWIDHARIAKDKYQRLVQWSGRSLHWWFDIDSAVPETKAALNTQETPGVYHLDASPKWPFSRSYEDFNRLSAADKGRADGYLAGLIDASGHNGGMRLDRRDGSKHGP